jgi:hypothetical protein
MVHDGAIEAITAYLVKWMAKEQKNHKPKKLLKKVAKKGIASPEAFKEWLARLKSGAIPGYRLDTSEGVIKSTSGPPPSSPGPPGPPPKRKNKRKPDRPETTVEYTKFTKGRGPPQASGEAPVNAPEHQTDDQQRGPGEAGPDGDTSPARAKKRRPAAPREGRVDGDPEEDTWRLSAKRFDIKTGSYSAEERQVLLSAIKKYAINHGFDPESFDWLLGKKHSQVDGRGMWTEIARNLPQRSIKSVAAAALRLFHPYAGKGAFSQSEDEALRGLVQAHGNKWTEFSVVLKRTPDACRLRWRDIKDVDTRQSGRWSEAEERALAAAVEKYGNPSKLKGDGKDRRVLLDNIDWEAVVPHVPTRNRTQCVAKWYLRLAPSMADRGLWGKGNDKILLKSLWNLVQNSKDGILDWQETTVPWSELVEGRTGDECRRRWALMKKSVVDAKNKEFVSMVDELVTLYCPKFKEGSSQAHT